MGKKNLALLHGRGIKVWTDRTPFERYWGDKANAHGKLTHSGGDIYQGELPEDKVHGFGVYTYIDKI